MKFNLLTLISAVSALFLPTLLFATDNNKVALIIGNNEYLGREYPKLATCKNDAIEMDKCLTKLGYKTIVVYDANTEEIEKAVKSFDFLSRKAKVGIFYYSGHATYFKSQCIVPAKTELNTNEYTRDYYDIDFIRNILAQNCQYSFLFIDGCRTIHKGSELFKAGLQIPTNVKEGSDKHQQCICYATGFGEPALSGVESNKLSPFTEELTKYLFDEREFRVVWYDIITNVQAKANQTPEKSSNFFDNFYFNENKIPSIYKKSIVSEKNASKNKGMKEIILNVTPISEITISGKTIESGKKYTYDIGNKYIYVITHDGYETKRGTIEVTDETPSVININLDKIREAKCIVKCKNPKNAKVYIDGEYKGTTPLAITTSSGWHDIRFAANNYYTKDTRIHLYPGDNEEFSVTLTRDIPDFFDFYKGDSSLHINYHFSLKYPIGLSATYGNINESRFSAGLIYASSIGLYKGSNQLSISQSITIHVGSTTETIVVGDGNLISVTKKTETVNPEVYSKELDPNNEAKKYDSNALILANVGFDACNGIMIEAGVGAAYHQKRYFMQNENSVLKTTIINNSTGELIGEPTYTYSKTGRSRWYRNKSKWSPAIRLGARFLIPLYSGDFDEYSLTIGGGYTYLPMNNAYSSWDVSLGVIIPLGF